MPKTIAYCAAFMDFSLVRNLGLLESAIERSQLVRADSVPNLAALLDFGFNMRVSGLRDYRVVRLIVSSDSIRRACGCKAVTLECYHNEVVVHLEWTHAIGRHLSHTEHVQRQRVKQALC